MHAYLSKLSCTLFRSGILLPVLLRTAAAWGILALIFRFLPVRTKRFTRRELFRLLLVTSAYAVVSLTRLGTAVFPHTTWQPARQGQSFIMEFTESTRFDAVYMIYGEGDNNANPDTYQLGVSDMTLEGSNDLENWTPVATAARGSIYQYQIIPAEYDFRYIRLIVPDKNGTLSEIGFRAYGAERFLGVRILEDEYADSEYPAALCIDEQDSLVTDPLYYDEGYFDEVYHPRNAWEIANGQYMYASVHPLLGTSLIALSIKLLGMHPLAWRLPGALTGILLVPLIYVMARDLTGRKNTALLAAVLLSADFMHLTTSRIATLEPFSVFFILLMFYYMTRYVQTDFFRTPFSVQMRYLLLCGIMTGLGIAVKWTACYSAAGLAVLFFTHVIRAFLQTGRDSSLRGKYADILLPTILLCFVFFIFIPVIIYILAYMPTKVWRDGWSISNVLSQIRYIYNYHISLEATHPYQSTWYQWLLDLRPIWYFGRTARDGMYYSIACFSNPLLCWAGLPSVLLTGYLALVKKDREAYIILVGYLSALLPWVSLVQRCVFAYHFYPTSLFMILSIAHSFRYLEKKDPAVRTLMRVYAAACVLLFFLFLPATAASATSRSFIHFLEWLPGWYFG